MQTEMIYDRVQKNHYCQLYDFCSSLSFADAPVDKWSRKRTEDDWAKTDGKNRIQSIWKGWTKDL